MLKQSCWLAVDVQLAPNYTYLFLDQMGSGSVWHCRQMKPECIWVYMTSGRTFFRAWLCQNLARHNSTYATKPKWYWYIGIIYASYGFLGNETATNPRVKVPVYLVEKVRSSTANADYPSSMIVAKFNALECPIRLIYLIYWGGSRLNRSWTEYERW